MKEINNIKSEIERIISYFSISFQEKEVTGNYLRHNFFLRRIGFPLLQAVSKQ